MKKIKTILLSGLMICGCIMVNTAEAQKNEQPLSLEQNDFYNLIDIKNVPLQEKEYSLFAFSDCGAWAGFALPENESNQYAGAFIGPMAMNGRGWLAASLAVPELYIDDNKYDLARNVQTVKYFPGRLVQEFRDEQLYFITELCFASSRTALVRSQLKNVSNHPVKVSLKWAGGVFNKNSEIRKDGKSVSILHLPDSTYAEVSFRTCNTVDLINKDSLQAIELSQVVLQPNEMYQSEYTQTLMLRRENVVQEKNSVAELDIDECFEENRKRWNENLDKLLTGESKYLKDNKYRRVIVKAMMTLNSNWRSAAGDILHAGSYPSYNEFFGVWSWDSWKIASANALYNPEMAKDEMRALFDYQAPNGMVPDFIGFNKKGNNWRDTKPPVAAWGAMNVYKATGDKAFLQEMFDKLYKFHKWWYAERDHNHNGICEYGSTDGTLIAAAWESGMDNGVRFDEAQMLKNGENAWSMNQENICLNSFLYAEKNILSEMATILGNKDLSASLSEEAQKVKEYIQTKMFDPETGFFYDIRIGSGDFIRVMGAECWLPLWAGVATPEQAKKVMEKMKDPARFNSTLPLGTLDVSHPKLRPTRGYWRGPVWVDQVYFGIVGLRNYGYDEEADYFTEKFIENAQGLTTDGPIPENYNPLTGETLNCPNFGWSSAVIIKMLLNK